MGIAEAVRQLREQRRLTKAELAARCGLAPSYLSRLESGDYRSPTVATLVTIARGLEVDPRELLVLAGFVPEDMARARRQLAEDSITRLAESAILSISRTAAKAGRVEGVGVNGLPKIDRALLADRLRALRRDAARTARDVARRASARLSLITELETGRADVADVDLRRLLTDGYGLDNATVDDLLFETGLSGYLADDVVLSPESRRMTLEFARLARIRDRQSLQGRSPSSS
ncbi:MAG: XRE family transcriptional regulator [Actinobacteria bacterium]|nr:XRE family transcriptional regulator [Actinomycetota bacterium]